MILIFDTALTGRYHYRDPDDAAIQPHLARLGLMVVTSEGNTILEQVNLIAPDASWRYEVDAIAAHHIAPAVAAEQGIALADAVLPLVQALGEATDVVAFNYDHHRRALIRAGFDVGLEIPVPHPQHDGRAFCAMRFASPYTRLTRMSPGGGYRWPKMFEAYAHFARDDLQQSNDPIEQGRINLQAIRVIYDGIVAAGQAPL